MLKRHIDIRQDAPFSHQRNHLVDTRIRIDIVQARPHAHVAQGDRQFFHPRLDRRAVPEAGAVLDVDAICRCVLRDHQQFAHPGLDQVFRLAQHQADIAAHQITAHRWNDAEGAAMIAAFGNLQVRIVFRRQLDALRRHQVGERVMRFRQMRMHRRHHFLHRMRAGHRQHLRMRRAHHIAFGAQAAGDDHATVRGQRLADRIKRFLHRRVDEAAGIDHHQIGAFVGWRDAISFGTQLGQYLFGVDQRFRAAQRHESHLRWRGGAGSGCGVDCGHCITFQKKERREAPLHQRWPMASSCRARRGTENR